MHGLNFFPSLTNPQSPQNKSALCSLPCFHPFWFSPCSSWTFLSTAPSSQVFKARRNHRSGKELRDPELQLGLLGDLGPKPVWWWGAEAGDSTPLFLNAPLVLKDTSPSCCSQNQAGLYSWVKTECQAVYFLYLSVEMRLFLCLCGADTARSQPVKCGTFPVI